mgnify:CR=1 FL=1
MAIVKSCLRSAGSAGDRPDLVSETLIRIFTFGRKAQCVTIPISAPFCDNLVDNHGVDLIPMAESQTPNYREGKPLMPYEKSFIEIERILLPSSNGGAQIELILIFSIFR